MTTVLNSVVGQRREMSTGRQCHREVGPGRKCWGVALQLKSRRYFKPFKSYCCFCFYGRHLGFPVEGDVRFLRRYSIESIEKPVPKNVRGVDTGLVYAGI